MIALGVSAYTFTVAFSVNTLWDQDTKLEVIPALAFDSTGEFVEGSSAKDHADDLPTDIDEKIEGAATTRCDRGRSILLAPSE